MKQNNKYTWIWISVLLLFVGVAATTVALTSRMNEYYVDDSGAISLIQEPVAEAPSTNTVTEDTASTSSTDAQIPTDTTTDGASSVSTDSESAASVRTDDQEDFISTKNPGFEIEDGKQVWGTDTQVEIFRVSYENDGAVITVQSNDGDKIIAPGTENSYVFKLKNTGNVALKYYVTLDAYVTGTDIALPLTARLSRYDGAWIVGGAESYGAISDLDAAEDNGTLGAGNFTYYTLDWLWPFDSGNDELDTILGNLVAEQEITFTIVITTTATESTNPDDDGGLTPPPTHDNMSLALPIGLAIGACAVLFLVILFRIRDSRREDTEAETP